MRVLLHCESSKRIQFDNSIKKKKGGNLSQFLSLFFHEWIRDSFVKCERIFVQFNIKRNLRSRERYNWRLTMLSVNKNSLYFNFPIFLNRPVFIKLFQMFMQATNGINVHFKFHFLSFAHHSNSVLREYSFFLT